MSSPAHRSPASAGRRSAARSRSLAAGSRSLTAGGLLAVASAIALAAGAGGAAGSTAGTARTITLNDSGQLHKTGSHGFYLNEAGQATGTIGGALYLHLHILGVADHVTAEVSIYPRGSSISGSASAGYHVNGATASFSGTMSVTRGTGGYANAHGSGLSFSGTIQRKTDTVTVHVNGRLSV